MSHAAMSWATAQTTGSPARKAVLLVLADVADPSGVAFPSVRQLVEVTELGERTVRRATTDLQASGLLACHERRQRSGRQRSSLYVLAPDAVAGRGNMKPVEESDGYATWIDAGGDTRPAAVAGGPPAAAAPQGCQSGTPVSTEPSLDPSPSSRSAPEPAQPGTIRATTGDLLATFGPLVAAGRLDDPRVDGSDLALAVAIEQHGEATVRAAVDHIASWVTDSGNPLRIRSLSRLLPSALERARRAQRAAAGVPGDRPSWSETQAALVAAVGRFGRDRQLDALRELADAAPAAAALIVEIGWREWCDTSHAGRAGGTWLAEVQQRYARLKLDTGDVRAKIDLLERLASQRAALDAGEMPDYGDGQAAA